MKDAYYYFYYMVVIFLKRTYKKQPMWYRKTGIDFYLNGGITIVGLLIGFNFIAALFSLMSKTPKGFEYLFVIPIIAINYYLLERGDRFKKIFEEYNEKFNASSNKKLIVTVAILYVLVTLVSTAIIIVWRYRMNHHHSSL